MQHSLKIITCVPYLLFSLNKLFTYSNSGLQIRVHTRKLFFFIPQPKHMLWVLKRTVSMRRFFLAPKNMFKLMHKKIFAILRKLFLLNWHYGNYKSSKSYGAYLIIDKSARKL